MPIWSWPEIRTSLRGCRNRPWSASSSCTSGDLESEPFETHLGVQIADSLHPVANPAVDREGNLYSTFSGSRGQKSPVSIYKIDTNYNSKPFVTDLMNPTGLAFDREGLLYVSSRYDGIIYQITPTGNMSVYVEGMGVATGIAFDPRRKPVCRRSQRHHFQDQPVAPDLCFCHARAVHCRLSPGIRSGRLSVRHRAHDVQFRFRLIAFRMLAKSKRFAGAWAARKVSPSMLRVGLYVAASLPAAGASSGSMHRRKPEQFLSGPGIVGLAFSPSRALILATHNALYRVDVNIAGRPMP